jgi:hypothetical protein
VVSERGCRAAGVLEGLLGLMVERFAEFRSLMPVMHHFNGLLEADGDERTFDALAQSIEQSTDEEILAVFESELPKKIGDMEFCRAFSNVQLARNLLVREVPEEKLEHLAFPCCQ